MWTIDTSMPTITRRLAASTGGLRLVLRLLRGRGAPRVGSDAGSAPQRAELPAARTDRARNPHSDPGPRRALELADIDPALESARLRLFVMTGRYWRGM